MRRGWGVASSQPRRLESSECGSGSSERRLDSSECPLKSPVAWPSARCARKPRASAVPSRRTRMTSGQTKTAVTSIRGIQPDATR
eukprot:scaffold23565_cov71-Phaeocystis_antarctica.AAC.8